jgi:hypothetical protein
MENMGTTNTEGHDVHHILQVNLTMAFEWFNMLFGDEKSGPLIFKLWGNASSMLITPHAARDIFDGLDGMKTLTKL